MTKSEFRTKWHAHLTSPNLYFLVEVWCLLAFTATPVLMLRSSPFVGKSPEWVIGLIGFVVGLILIRTLRTTVAKLITRPFYLPTLGWALIVGAILRLTWVLVFPSMPQSDGSTYLQLAQAIASGQPYETAGTVAYWPVGYPLWLAGWLLLFDTPQAIVVSQLVAYLIGAIGIYSLASQLSGVRAALIAVWTFTLWPNLLAQLATPEKESVVIALLPWVMFFILRTSHKWQYFFSGALLGLAILVQPSLQFLLPLLIFVLWLQTNSKSIIFIVILFIAGAVSVIGPWTLRNYAVFGKLVLVSTNGGDNFYRANNGFATGGYTDVGEQDISKLNELDRDRIGKKLGIKWIKENPSAFIRLGFEKQIRFMGDDSATIYATLQRGGGTKNKVIYATIKLFANLWWLFIWLLLAILVQFTNKTSPKDHIWLLWGWLYLFILHSVFESASKYHLPMIWIPCILLGCYLVDIDTKRIK